MLDRRVRVWWRQCAWLLVVFALVGVSRAESASPWQRVVVIGASASSGFIVTEPFGGTNTLKCRLGYYLESALQTQHEPIRNFATAMFFLSPEGMGKQQVEAALKQKPTLVVGVDFLFWYCYGDDLNDEARRQLFERGLKELDQFHCPLIVGDVPDASYATNSGIISASQVPSPAALKNANVRLKEWAASHSNVTVIPLAHLMKAINGREPLTCHGQTLEITSSTPMIQADHLHPTPRGAAWLALEILDIFTEKKEHDLAKDVRWNPTTVYQAGLKLSQQHGT